MQDDDDRKSTVGGLVDKLTGAVEKIALSATQAVTQPAAAPDAAPAAATEDDARPLGRKLFERIVPIPSITKTPDRATRRSPGKAFPPGKKPSIETTPAKTAGKDRRQSVFRSKNRSWSKSRFGSKNVPRPETVFHHFKGRKDCKVDARKIDEAIVFQEAR